MKKFLAGILALTLTAVTAPQATAQDWPLCRQPQTVNQLYNYFSNAGQGNQSWVDYVHRSFTFKGASFVQAGHRNQGDYSLTTCAAEFEIVAPNGQVVTWTQRYVVRHGQMYDINPNDASNLANQLWAMR